MEVLRRCCRVTNLQIVFRAKLEVSLETRARVFRSLSFVTMRQQHHHSRSLFPLVLRSRDVLVDNRLRAVTEITKLRFPQNERALVYDRVAVLKSQHAFFRQRTVEYIKTRLRICFRMQL